MLLRDEKDSPDVMAKTVFAAGTVCWRRVVDARSGKEVVMVLLVHRTKQRDVSFAKGKLDKGESMPQAAVRETYEETGLKVTLGVNLGTISYLLPGGVTKKTVQYWAAEVTEQAIHASTFVPNKEICALEWVAIDQVRERLSYSDDAELFGVFERLVARDAIDSFAVILLRHAKAAQRGEQWPIDHLRPLTDIGEHQAETLAHIIEPFGPERILSSSALRCASTVHPLAELTGLAPKIKHGLSQDAWEDGDLYGLRKVIGKTVRKTRTTVLCSHRPVLPDAIRELVLATGSMPGEYFEEASALPPAGFSVFHLSKKHPGSGILAVETYPLQH